MISLQEQSKDESPVRESIPAFRGSFAHTVDGKGRVSLPSEFRRVLSGTGCPSVVVTNNISQGARCLDGYGVGAWEEFEAKLRSKSRFDPRVQKLENYYLSRATLCPIDGSGRIMLPANLRTYAAMEREVTFTAAVHGFRIWDTRVWEHIFAAAEEALLADPAMLAELDV